MARPFPDNDQPDDLAHPAWSWLTRAAFACALILVIARAMLPQYLRDLEPLAPLAPGEFPTPRAAGPAVGVFFDCIAMLLGLLVLLRLSLDRNWRLQRTLTVVPAALLAVYAFASTLWASDKFAAAASASTWLAAAALLFVFAQTVRTWSRLRVVAGVAVGLFLANIAFGVIYRVVDLPDLQEEFQRTKLDEFAARNWDPDSFAARNFESRIMQGQTGGFAASPNSYGATLVLLGFVTLGLAWQRWRERSEPGWALVLAVTLLPGLWVLWTTQSRSAMAAALLAAVVLAAAFPARHLLGQRRERTFAVVVGILVLGAALLVGIGLVTDTLPHESLAFRWNYWVGAAGVFADRPLLGTGFANFGDSYLAHRLPIAAEEIKDPHNLLVRFATEMGIAGGLLAIGWLLAFIWGQTRAADRPDDEQRPWPGAPIGLPMLAGITALGIVVHAAAAVDVTSDPYYVFLELVRRGLYGLLILGGLVLGSIRSAHDPSVSTAPAPALLAAIVAGLGAALLHSMVDVVVFETPVLISFVMLMGAAVGIRAPETTGAARGITWAVSGLAGAATAAFIVLFALPLITAESSAAEGDALLRGGRPSAALHSYRQAVERAPVSNAHYHRRLAMAAAYAQRPPQEMEQALLRAIAAHPLNVPERALLARLYLTGYQPPRLSDAAATFEEILRLNPNELSLRREYADVLEALNRPGEAAEQLQLVLRFNDRLHPQEPERLTPAQVEEIQRRIEAFKGAAPA